MKTWADIEEAAICSPVLHMAVALVKRGDMTREQALIAATLGLVEHNAMLFAKLMDYVNSTLPPIFVVLNDKSPPTR